MPTAREIKSALQRQEQDRIKRRQDALMAVVTAAAKAIKGRDAAQQRKAELREQFERALAAEDARVAALEAAAGQAVLAAMGGELEQAGCAFREGELRDLTGIAAADLRRWQKAARLVGNGDGAPPPTDGVEPSGHHDGADAPA